MSPAGQGTYTLPNDWEHARRRLELIGATYDPGSTRRFTRLGVGPGWRCLEVGGGGGSITRWLSGRVGPDGRVVAVDLETRFLEEIDDPNVEVHRLDLAVEDLPAGPFDLVHSRAVLCHIPEREEILGRLVASLRPDGRLLVEEPDNEMLLSMATGVYAEAWVWMNEAMAAGGLALAWARGLPGLVAGHGLVDVGAECDGIYYPGDSPVAELFRLTWAQLRDRAVAAGADPAVLDLAAKELDDPDRWFPAVPIVAAWGRRPG